MLSRVLNYLFLILGLSFSFVCCKERGSTSTTKTTTQEKNPIEIQAHRAGRGYWSEMSLDAFRWSVQNKFDVIEFDVNFSKEGTPFVVHNHFVNKAQNDTPCASTSLLYLFEMTDEEIKKRISCHTAAYNFTGKRDDIIQTTVSSVSERRLFTLEETLNTIKSELEKVGDQNYASSLKVSIEIKQGNEEPTEHRIKTYTSAEKKNLISLKSNWEILTFQQ